MSQSPLPAVAARQQRGLPQTHRKLACRATEDRSRSVRRGGQRGPIKERARRNLARGDTEAAGIIHGAIEDFSQEFALVIRRFLKLKEWKDTERLVIGGGFRAGRVGELVIGRTAVLLKADKVNVDLIPIHNDPDEAGLLGSVHLAPAWMFKAFEAILGVDIGGTNIRAGVVQLGRELINQQPQ